MMPSKLFENFKINTLTLKNHFVMSAAADNLDNDPAAQTQRFATLATGGVGLIISGALTIDKIAAWGKITDAVHEHNGKLALQIMVRGGPGETSWTNPDEEKIVVSVLPKNSVYFHSFIKYSKKQREATDEDLTTIIETYAKTAEKAKAVGADAIQIHSAHQNFLCHFLSPITNKRIDKWGGSIENKTRIHCEIIKAIRSKVGDDFPVLIKLGVEDVFAQGLKFAEGKQAAEIIAKSGYDGMEISQGLQNINDFNLTSMRFVKNIKDEAYFRNWCHEIKRAINIPTIMTGGLRTYALIEEIVNNNETDLIGMCRPFIREPNLINRWQNGDHNKTKCISCNKCITELLIKGKPLACYLDQ